MNDTTDLIQRTLQAWTDGGLDALEAILDSQVGLRWVKPSFGTAPDATVRACDARQVVRLPSSSRVSVSKGELSSVVVEMLGRVLVDLGQGHRVFEVGIPVRWEVHCSP